MKFIATLRDKAQGGIFFQEIDADSIRDAKDELESGMIQVVSIRQIGATRVASDASAYVSTRRLKNQLAWQQAKQLLHESGMLGEEITPREAYENFRGKLGWNSKIWKKQHSLTW